MNKAVATLAVILTPCTLVCTPVLAQRYPDKAISFVVPYAPGGGNELLARTIAQKLSESIGQPVIVESRAGADGTIGSNYVARAAPDGYTILMGTNSTHGLAKFTTKSLAYDPVKDFTPLTEATEMPVVLAVHTSVPVSNVKEFVEYTKKNPGKISFGSPGAGGLHHFAGELLNHMTGTDMVHVPYKGSGPSMQDLVGGQIPAAFASLSAAAPQMRGARSRCWGLSGQSASRARRRYRPWASR